jgi:flagellar basal body rod protein FlgG
MLHRLRNAAASMGELAHRQDRVANNLANANTVGFQRDRAFGRALDERLDFERTPQSIRVAGQWADQTLGALQETGNPLDLALTGDGFFAVQTPAGETRYTRAGEFLMDADGTVRSAQGNTLLDTEGQPLVLPPTGGDIAVMTSGEVRVGRTAVGRIQIVAFEDPAAMTRVDAATFTADGLAQRPPETDVRQGFLESSNVNAVTEMADLITHVRLFETQQKSLRTTDEVLAGVTRDLGAF